MPYDNQTEYIKHNAGCDCENPESCSCEASCGCCPVGTVAVYDECGKHVGCLTPNDAAEYSVDTIDVPPGYVKVFDGDTYVGILTVADYCEYLECIGQAPTPETVTTLVDNGDGSFTYTSEDATETTIPAPPAETITTLVDNGDGSFTYTSEDTTQTTIPAPTNTGLVHVHSETGSIDYSWSGVETVVPSVTFTASSAGIYQVQISLESRITTPGGGVPASVMRLYVGGVLQTSVPVTSGNISAGALSEAFKNNTFFWRGSMSASDVVEVRTLEGASDDIVTSYYNILVNKEQ